MAENSHEIQTELRNTLGREVERVSNAVARFLNDLISNSRWFTTLVVAEVGAMAKLSEASHGWKFGITILGVILLGLSAACFLLAMNLAQDVKNTVQTESDKILLKLPTIDFASAVPADLAEILSDLRAILEKIGRDSEQQARFSFGLGLFFLGSTVAGIALFVS